MINNEFSDNFVNYYSDDFGQPECQCTNGYCDSSIIDCVDKDKLNMIYSNSLYVNTLFGLTEIYIFCLNYKFICSDIRATKL